MWVKSTFSHLFLIIPKSTCTHTDSLQYELEVIDFHCSRLIRYWTINTATCTTEPRYTFLGNKDASRMNYSYLSYYTDNVQIFTMDWSFRIVTVSELSQFQNCHSFRIVTHWEKQGYVMLNSKLSNTVIQQRRTLTLTANGDMMDKYQTVDIF